ncbi:MAG: ethylbenzene dehydrogenase-related protein [Magnetococcus sp. DMHC-6]
MLHIIKCRLLLPVLTLGLLLSAPAGAESAQQVIIRPLSFLPTVDGDLTEWAAVPATDWNHIKVEPALEKDEANQTGSLTIELAMGIHDDRLFIAVRWPDDNPDLQDRPWEWHDNKYRRSKMRDDMFAIRFHLSGTYDACMLPKKPTTYQTDLWRWSAGRSNLAGLAEDMYQTISTDPLTDATEYGEEGIDKVYIKKTMDEGAPFYKTFTPSANKQENRMSSFTLTQDGSGSLTDVTAKGIWKDQFWHLEMARKLNTGYTDDVIFTPGIQILGGIAVFNKGYAEHKSVAGNLLFDFSKMP